MGVAVRGRWPLMQRTGWVVVRRITWVSPPVGWSPCPVNCQPHTRDQALRLRGVRPAGPPPRPSAEPIRVQRRASATGVIMVAGQKAALGRSHAGQTVTVMVSGTTLAIEFPDGDTRVIRRTTTQPVRSIKGQRPRTATPLS